MAVVIDTLLFYGPSTLPTAMTVSINNVLLRTAVSFVDVDRGVHDRFQNGQM
jgi:hypothetical protein